MFSSQRQEQLAAFPVLPEALKNRYSISELGLRPFGIYESDLNVDFNATPRPFLITEILDCCTRDVRGNPVKRDFFWDLTVGTRIECLLRLVTSEEQSEIPLVVRCPCGGELEIELTTSEISDLQVDNDEAIRVTAELSLRRPTGNDQLAWLGQSYESESEALRRMLCTLIVEGAEQSVSGSAALTEISQVMDEHDPLINFSVQVQCPDCGQEHVCEIDLEELSLNRLRQAQFHLLATVHRLAAHYHWSEEEIFKVPHWRRDHYLRLVDG